MLIQIVTESYVYWNAISAEDSLMKNMILVEIDLIMINHTIDQGNSTIWFPNSYGHESS